MTPLPELAQQYADYGVATAGMEGGAWRQAEYWKATLMEHQRCWNYLRIMRNWHSRTMRSIRPADVDEKLTQGSGRI